MKCTWAHKKLKKVGKATHGRPTLLTTINGGWSSWRTTKDWCLRSNMSSTKHVGGRGMSSYACQITSGDVMLIRIHWNRWTNNYNIHLHWLTKPNLDLLSCYQNSWPRIFQWWNILQQVCTWVHLWCLNVLKNSWPRISQWWNILQQVWTWVHLWCLNVLKNVDSLPK